MDISLSAGMRASVLALQDNASLFDTTQTRLATGKAVNTALDDPLKYFSAQNNTFAASGLSALKDSMNQALQTITAANNGITAITALVKQAIALAQNAQSNFSQAGSLNTQYTALLTQIDSVANDATYAGTDLIGSTTTTLHVSFNSAGTSSVDIVSVDATSSTGLSISNTSSWGSLANISTDIASLQAALTTLQTDAQTLSAQNGLIQARISFTDQMINTLQSGADKLTLADLNKEGANMLALQTQQALATNSLRLASQASQGVLRLFQ